MAEEDLIFGKNRHFFGGIEPSNMTNFIATLNGNKVKLNLTLPTDTVINGQTLCTVAGAMVRRSLTSFPKDEFDGVLVADVKEDSSFDDSTSDAKGTYYYTAFPYTTQGVYNRNPKNRVVYNEPRGMVSLTSISMYDAMANIASIRISAKLPSGVVGALIKRSTVSFPVNETEGKEIFNITTNGDFEDVSVVVGTKYYYSAFPYTSTGAYNRDVNNRTAVVAEKLDGPTPDNMRTFSVVLDENITPKKLKITAVLPNDTVIDGKTCTIAGAIIRRSTTSFPKDEFDGDLLIKLVEDKTFYDETADVNGTYYYAAFPYSIQGVYNRNAANRSVYNEPEGMVSFSSKSIYNAVKDTVEIQLVAEIPNSVVGSTIRRSTLNYPVDELDGDLFLNITSSGTYADQNVVDGTKYYYSAFPYTSTGAYNYDVNNRTSATATKYSYLYGFDLNTADSNPSTRVTYPSGVDNSNFSAAFMNFTSRVFNYGNWSSHAGEKFMPRPCMLKYDGTVDHYLNQNDYTKKVDGTASAIANTSFGGNAMMEWSKIYTKRELVNGVYIFRCCDIKLDNGYECWCNYNKDNVEIDHFYTPIYFGSNVSSKMRSLSGQSNYVNGTASNEITFAKANGAYWYTEVVADRLLIQDLLVMMSKNTDTQTAFGWGRCGQSNSSAISCGTMNTKGLFWGDDDQTSGVKVFGMENFWGNLYRRTAGWMLVNGVQKMKLTQGIKDGSTVSDYNIDGSGYISISGANPTGSSGGYIKGMKTEAYGRIPFNIGGSSTTYEADSMYYSGEGTYYAYVGGYWGDGTYAGAFFVFLNNPASAAYTSIGASLSCKPLG